MALKSYTLMIRSFVFTCVPVMNCGHLLGESNTLASSRSRGVGLAGCRSCGAAGSCPAGCWPWPPSPLAARAGEQRAENTGVRYFPVGNTDCRQMSKINSVYVSKWNIHQVNILSFRQYVKESKGSDLLYNGEERCGI